MQYKEKVAEGKLLRADLETAQQHSESTLSCCLMQILLSDAHNTLWFVIFMLMSYITAGSTHSFNYFLKWTTGLRSTILNYSNSLVTLKRLYFIKYRLVSQYEELFTHLYRLNKNGFVKAAKPSSWKFKNAQPSFCPLVNPSITLNYSNFTKISYPHYEFLRGYVRFFKVVHNNCFIFILFFIKRANKLVSQV